MDWLNYHHLLYFWTVVSEGSLRQAAEALNVSQPSISTQLSTLEEAIGQPLFYRSGRTKALTDTGRIVYSYAQEIFALGQELQTMLKGEATSRMPRLQIGITDSVPKLVTQFLLRPVFNRQDVDVRLICREGKATDLLSLLALGRLDLVISDEPASSEKLHFKTFNHTMGDSGITFCAVRNLAVKLRQAFPMSLNGCSALLPAEGTALRQALMKWFKKKQIIPRIVGEFDDAALMKVMATEATGFTIIPSIIFGVFV